MQKMGITAPLTKQKKITSRIHTHTNNERERERERLMKVKAGKKIKKDTAKTKKKHVQQQQ